MTPDTPQHGGARPGAGRPEAPYERITVSFQIPAPLRDKWDAHCAKHKLSRPASLAKWLKWKKPTRKLRK